MINAYDIVAIISGVARAMKDADRFKLYFGPYKTPRFKYGRKVWCERRGWMKIVGLSDAKIPCVRSKNSAERFVL